MVPEDALNHLLQVLPSSTTDGHLTLDTTKMTLSERMYAENYLRRSRVCEGCKQPVPLHTWHAHNRDCAEIVVECPWAGCTHRCPRRLMDTHATTACEHRREQCRWCREMVPAAQMAPHLETCPQRMVRCEDCGKSFLQQQLARHRRGCSHRAVRCRWNGCTECLPHHRIEQHQRDCPHRVVGCSWCKAMVPARELDAHRAECAMRPMRCAVCAATLQAPPGSDTTSVQLHRDHMLLQHWLPQLEDLIVRHCMTCDGCDSVKITAKDTCGSFKRMMGLFQGGHCDHCPHSQCAMCRQLWHLMNNHSTRCERYRRGDPCDFPLCPNYPVECSWHGCKRSIKLQHRRDHEQICDHRPAHCPHCFRSFTARAMTSMQIRDHVRKCRVQKLYILRHVQSCARLQCPAQEGPFRCTDVRGWNAHYNRCERCPADCDTCQHLVDVDPDPPTTAAKRRGRGTKRPRKDERAARAQLTLDVTKKSCV